MAEVDAPLLAVEDVWTTFRLRRRSLREPRREVQAVAGVSIELEAGRTLALVGESGSGKSTLARSIIGLEHPRRGRVVFAGADLVGVAAGDGPRRDMQIVFQDPRSSLNPRMSVREIVAEGWQAHPQLMPRERRRAEAEALLARVGVDPALGDRRPSQLSGGQCQRVSIARALAMRPTLLVCDEAVSALDVSVQAQILELLTELQDELGLALLFISHDLGVVRQIAHRVAVMYLGRIVEEGEAEALYRNPVHPYTQALLAAAMDLGPEADEAPAIRLSGTLPSPADPPSGCRFRTRCWRAQERCAVEEPELERRGFATRSACHFAAPLDDAAGVGAPREGTR